MVVTVECNVYGKWKFTVMGNGKINIKKGKMKDQTSMEKKEECEKSSEYWEKGEKRVFEVITGNRSRKMGKVGQDHNRLGYLH